MIFQITKGASYVIKGFGLLKLEGVKRYVVIPTLINIILFAGAIWYGTEQFDSLLDQYLPSWLEWLEFVLWPLFVIASLLIVFFAFTLVANIFGAPFNGVLAEKIEAQLSQQKLSYDEGYLKLLRGARIGIANEFKKTSLYRSTYSPITAAIYYSRIKYFSAIHMVCFLRMAASD